MKNELIEDIRISGDFFEILPVSGLENQLRGKNAFHIIDLDVHPSEYIFGIADREFFKTFFEV